MKCGRIDFQETAKSADIITPLSSSSVRNGNDLKKNSNVEPIIRLLAAAHRNELNDSIDEYCQGNKELIRYLQV